MAKYLDYTGLKHYDEKIKSIISTEVDARKTADTVINTTIETLNNDKVNRVMLKVDHPRIYGVAGSSIIEKMYDLYVDAQGDSIPLRDANGFLYANASTTDKSVVNYKQLTELLLNYLKKSGGDIAGSLTIQGDLTVKGSTVTENTESLNVKDAIIVTNSDGTELGSTLAGFVIRLNATDCYGVIYDKSSDSVKLGLGKITDGKFAFNTGEGEAVATRADSTALTDKHLIQWDGTNFRLVDAQMTVEQIIAIDAHLDSTILELRDLTASVETLSTTVDTVSEAAENARLMAKGAQEAASAAQSSANTAQSAAEAAQGTADNALSEAGAKLDKLTGAISAYDVAYIKKGGDGDNQSWVAITSDAEKNTLVKRDSSGKIKVTAGTAGAEAVCYLQLAAVDTKAGTAQTTADLANTKAENAQTTANGKQDKLVSGTNIKTVNGSSILGSGDLAITTISDAEIDALFA